MRMRPHIGIHNSFRGTRESILSCTDLQQHNDESNWKRVATNIDQCTAAVCVYIWFAIRCHSCMCCIVMYCNVHSCHKFVLFNRCNRLLLRSTYKLVWSSGVWPTVAQEWQRSTIYVVTIIIHVTFRIQLAHINVWKSIKHRILVVLKRKKNRGKLFLSIFSTENYYGILNHWPFISIYKTFSEELSFTSWFIARMSAILSFPLKDYFMQSIA